MKIVFDNKTSMTIKKKVQSTFSKFCMVFITTQQLNYFRAGLESSLIERTSSALKGDLSFR
jgi:hypothetical protein